MSDIEDIAYSAVLQDTAIVAEVSGATTQRANGVNLRDVSVSIAAQAQSQDVACVTTNRVTAYYIKQDKDTVVAVARDNAPPRVLVAFLKEVATSLKSRAHAARVTSTDTGLTKNDYQSVLKSSYEKIVANRDNLQVARSEMDKVKQIMVENIDRLLERGERVNLLVDRTGEMSESANIFNRQATHLQRKMWFQNVKVIGVGIALLAGSFFAVSRAV